jgi:hypothetical protein
MQSGDRAVQFKLLKLGLVASQLNIKYYQSYIISLTLRSGLRV